MLTRSNTLSGVAAWLLAIVMLAPSAHAFEADQFYYIVNQHSGQSLDVTNASSDNGANVSQWSYWDGAHQQWRLLANDDGSHRLINRSSGQVLDVAGRSLEENANVLQWPWKSANNANQRWEIHELGNGAFSLMALHSRKALQVMDGSTNSGANIVQGSYYGAAHQRWRILPVGPAVPAPQELQAEDAIWLSGAVRQTEHGGFQGSAYVNYEPNEPDGFIQWHVDAEKAGTYRLTFRFANGAGDSRPGEIQIDDQPVALLPFGPTGGWDRWQVVSTSVYLTKGENRVRLTGTGADGGANIDSLELAWQSGNSAEEPTPSEMRGFATLNGGTTGGEGGREVTVSTLKDFIRFAGSNDAYIIRVQGIIPLSDMVSVGSNTTVVGVGDNSGFTGGGLQLKRVRNVIIRNLKLSFSRDDLIQIYDAHNIWIDHNELWNDRNHHKDYYDGLVDITRGSDYVTVSWNRLRDHSKGSLVGASDNNGDEDRGHLKVTYHHNLFENIDSRIPSLRFGTGHFYNNHVVGANFAVNSRMGAQMLVEGNIFESVRLPIATNRYSREDGYVVARNNRYLNSGNNEITQTGSFNNAPYPYQLDALDDLADLLERNAGVGFVR